MRLAALLALAIVLATPAAAAEDQSESVELVYEVPEGCPSRSVFVSAVSSRARRAKFVEHAARRLVVDIRRLAESFSGRLIVEQGSERAVREVTSARCEELVDAFVLFTALAIDPGASLAPPEDRPPPPVVAPPPAPARSLPLPRPPPSRGAADREPRPRRTWHGAFGSGGFVATGIAEPAMVSAHPVFDIALGGTGLAPSVRLGLAWADSASRTAGAGRLTFGLRALVLSGCALHMGLAHVVGLRLCALFEGGVLAVRPFAIEHPTSPDRPWFSAGPLGRVDVAILPKRLSLGADVGLAIPFERERVYASEDSTVAVVDGAGLRFTAVFLLQAF